mmetsp:Transcript_63922/g.87838  ORF Transcript_63922/g.87838 Transcript_63922/m.87838 type:complete len:203 (-) Transcript_63922:327-935(-)
MTDVERMTALHLAAQGGHTSVVHAILDTEGAIQNPLNLLGQTPLHIAAMEGHAHIVKALLAAGANPIIEDADKWSPEMYAEAGGYVLVEEMLKDSQCGPRMIREMLPAPKWQSIYWNDAVGECKAKVVKRRDDAEKKNIQDRERHQLLEARNASAFITYMKDGGGINAFPAHFQKKKKSMQVSYCDSVKSNWKTALSALPTA